MIGGHAGVVSARAGVVRYRPEASMDTARAAANTRTSAPRRRRPGMGSICRKSVAFTIRISLS